MGYYIRKHHQMGDNEKLSKVLKRTNWHMQDYSKEYANEEKILYR